jgi:antitoxin component of MazEF toxin-antitoxin module
MIKKLTKVGNSQALLMDKSTLEHLGVADGDSVELIHGSGQTIRITALGRTIPRAEANEIAKRLTDEYEDVLRKLAQ